MKVLDLFSGIGGFSLGLDRAGFETVAFCEASPYCQKVLAKHWPGIPIHDDIRTLDGEQYRGTVELVCGGFPCQDLSIAGHKRGIDGSRSGLFREMLRVVSECGPRFVIFENVAELLIGERGQWFAVFLNELAQIGLDAEWHCVSASSVGANHRRARIWIVAYPAGDPIKGSIFEGAPRQELFKCKPRGSTWGPVPGTHWSAPQPRITCLDDGVSEWVGAVSGYGNAVVPQIPELIGRAILASEAARCEHYVKLNPGRI